ncbi:nitric oxide synthase oxygenase [Streptomyces cavernae]|uniref:nitric oxide synthase oxygenase n=1 Tax=Streptomyces cavernae TaxID=2259034 RepID=UPI000FEBAC43|nr:nitric oxide synthase oxygenase [Streptomyces cavernae]
MNPSDTLTEPLTRLRAAITGCPHDHPNPGPVTSGTGRADLAEAEDFVRRHHREHPDQPGPLLARLLEIRRQIHETGTYRHTHDELVFGARVAWRNSSRCIGRLYWHSLRVLDLRDATAPEEIHQHLITHLREGTNGGRIRPTISVFAPDAPGRPGPRVWNDQLIRYAGYRQSDGSVVGDPAYAEFTELVSRMGWNAPGGPFDVLPLIISTHDTKPQLFDVPADDVLEVPLSHPEHAWFAELGVRWHALPAISNMRLRIGGIDYPLAPFNGWYMGTEIGARNLVDEDRYDLLPLIAARLGLDTGSETTLWRDRALVELNVAVLHSFAEAGVKISDHHTESRRFLTHVEKERRAGRTVPADWTWIVPPVSGGITPVFHRTYDQADQRPNFYLDPERRELGRGRCPYSHAQP